MSTNDKIKASPRGRLFLTEPHLWIPLGIMAITAAIFNLIDVDLAVQTYYYKDGWHLGQSGWVQFLYRHGNIPALIVSVGSLLLLIRNLFGQSKLIKYNKLALFLSLAMVIGPGIIVNTIFKDNWGRPRPRQLEVFGGRHVYEAPLNIDLSSDGKSFPCGHATMGFYFFALAFVFGIRKKLYYLLMTAFAAAYGALIGWGRMIQGGHFLSDVIFAGAMVYLSTWALWRIMKLDRNPFYVIKRKAIKFKLWQIVLLSVGVILLIAGISLATPYSSNQKLAPREPGDYHLQIGLQKANVELSFSDSTYVASDVQAFGFPGSKNRLRQVEEEGLLSFEQYTEGFFTELQTEIKVVVDTLRARSLDMNLVEGTLYLDLTQPVPQHLELFEAHQPSDPDIPKKALESGAYLVRAKKIVTQGTMK